MNFRHNKSIIFFVSFLVLFSSIANSKEPGGFTSTTIDVSPPDYAWISFMSSGPSDASNASDSPDGPRGMFYRLAFIKNDDVFSRPTMRIDEIVYGDAGCCWEVQRSWEVDFNKLEKSGVRMPPPQCSSIDSVVWLGMSTVKIKYGESECTISGIDGPNILAKCKLNISKPRC